MDYVDRLRADLLERLHWNVFGPLEDIQVRDEDGSTRPLSGHRIASESLANPPLTHVEVNIATCSEKHSRDETDTDDGRYQEPDPLVIHKDDDSPISLQDFVEQVHEFFNVHKDEIYRCEDEIYAVPEDLGGGQKVVGVDTTDTSGFEDSATGHYYDSSGNIPEGSKFFFDDAQINQIDTDEYNIYVSLFVEGNYGQSLDEFIALRKSAVKAKAG